jgi:hypothetical protein
LIGFEPLICADDPEAIEKAKRLVHGHDIELWSGERLVIRIIRDILLTDSANLYD